MRSSERARAALLVLLASFAGCALPTDDSDSLTLSFVDPPLQMLVGDTLRLRTQVSGGTVPLGEGDVTFVSSDEAVVVVGPTGVLTAVGEGRTQITAQLTRWEGASPVTHTLYVSRGIVITGLAGTRSAPGKVRFGETLVATGLRLSPDSLASVTINSRPVEISGYSPRDPQDPASLEELRIVVPVAPRASELLLIHAGGGTAARTLDIVQEDVLELDPMPLPVDLAEGPFRAPELTVGFPNDDWIRFAVPAGDWTFRLSLRTGFSFTGGAEYRFFFREASTAVDDFFNRWGREQAAFECNLPGRFLGYFGAPRRIGIGEVVIPLRLDAPLSLDFVANTEFGFVVPYRISAAPGYGSDLPPDEAEGNDFCNQAHPLGLGGPYDFSLDTSSDHDWYSFSVPGPPATFSVVSRGEQEDNDDFATAETLVPGTRVVGDHNDLSDHDYFTLELQAGTLLDVDVRSSLLPAGFPGRSVASDMMANLRLYDADRNLLAQSGFARDVPAPARDSTYGSDARIRYPVPATGTYYLMIDGTARYTNQADTGPHMYYAMDVFVHDLAGFLALEALAAGAPTDPQVVLMERRPGGRNVIIDRGSAPGAAEVIRPPLPPGDYYLLVYGAGGVAGDYTLSLGLQPPAAGAAGREDIP